MDQVLLSDPEYYAGTGSRPSVSGKNSPFEPPEKPLWKSSLAERHEHHMNQHSLQTTIDSTNNKLTLTSEVPCR
jgi:hypothetical protein